MTDEGAVPEYYVWLTDSENHIEHEKITFNTKQEFLAYLEKTADAAFHVSDDYILINGGWATVKVPGGTFRYLDPRKYL